MHASIRLYDALEYANNGALCRVEVRGNIVEDTDKIVGDERRILWRLTQDETIAVFHAFARELATQMAPLWNAPDCVLQHLQIGHEDPRAVEPLNVTSDDPKIIAVAKLRALTRAINKAGKRRLEALDATWDDGTEKGWSVAMAARAACRAACKPVWEPTVKEDERQAVRFSAVQAARDVSRIAVNLFDNGHTVAATSERIEARVQALRGE